MYARHARQASGAHKLLPQSRTRATTVQQVDSARHWEHPPRALASLVRRAHGAPPAVPTVARHVKPVLLGGGAQQRVPFLRAPASPAHLENGVARQVPQKKAPAQPVARESTVACMQHVQSPLALSVKQESTSRSRLPAMLCFVFRALSETIAMLRALLAASTAPQVPTAMPLECSIVKRAPMAHGRRELVPYARAYARAGSGGQSRHPTRKPSSHDHP
eukprot:TRINITY_DN4091_c0_g2_i1.p1 TRINITY_DN4091_c0_g2~~TRINITY_DN4091_c0_g2_i1.p1  ORF type:complete len:219 (-),score=27.07 TRINITY_DN4091_c0_g2_i1:84-740(-)